MTRNRMVSIAAAVGAIVLGTAASANAQATFADKAVKRLEGVWSTPNGRTIEFSVRGLSAKFTDNVGPLSTMIGGYRLGDAGADYVLEYPDGLRCYYNINFVPGHDGYDTAIFALRNAEPPQDHHICISGKLDRIR